MSDSSNEIQNSIKSIAANLVVIAAFNVGFVFFNFTLFIDVLILLVLAFCLFKWKSRVVSILILASGLLALYYQMDSPFDAGGWRIALIAWWVLSGIVSLYHTVRFQKSDASAVHT
ncbi:hypothetical protein H4J51_09410 [Colwellia sp. MB02u-18]|uniref:hypothetical protein n=1 Tax=unclassified Colwellia TaxID=196834 RepID=UPI0015F47424|nr:MULTISPECIES: hypothetical protein [unclassified Colwellia]MBA6225368.1 hypothetical protein [Colwellia sp. MB3u-45]MBA6267182.1 hypothetical protein [Colwellia sp. MB3u-43]MBA6322794.1 hypothetical protein [Colwellia sp. MB02u-19]MBA6324798.1 hypothetical protein [Colwellia sp. MB02u-18]MBA6331011.1 hypothetical protein [Colwellia sp. MB02u-12]